MNFSTKLVLAGLAASLLALPACERRAGKGGGVEPKFVPGSPPPHGQQSPRVLKAYIYSDPDDPTNKCFVDIGKATLWTKTKKGGSPLDQTVTWYSDDNKAYKVDFTTGKRHVSPFTDPSGYFQVPAGGSVSSGPLKTDSNDYYDFAIFFANGTTPCMDPGDPGLIVKP